MKNRLYESGPYFYFYASISVFLIFLLFPPVLHAADFSVTPIRMDFDRDVKTGVVTVSTEGQDRLNLQMRAYDWTQDDQGRDVYTETRDLVFFPMAMSLSKGEKRTIRAGVESPPVDKEKTYRLFVEEIPSPKKSQGASISITFRFGIPVFVKPLREVPGAEIKKAEVAEGVAEVSVENTGNVHLVISSVILKGKNAAGAESFSQELNGWYLLAGASRTYAARIPPEICKGLSKLYVEVAAEKMSLRKELELNSDMCLAKPGV